jgi:two-component system, cell cycle response regulator
MSDDKKSGGTRSEEITRLINPATDTLKIDLELAKATDPVLIVIRGGLQGKKYSLKGGPRFIVGRDKTADIQLDDSNISRQHCQIILQGEKILIEDMGSRNGTFVNDEKIDAQPIFLEKEDMIKVGSTILKFLPAGQLETLYHINLTNAAYMDKLTGLFNRKYISEVLEVEFKRAKALHTSLSLVVFDIDNFKKINDTYGHDGGDFVLQHLGQQVKASGLRERDLAGRYGGEEFIIVLTNSNSEQAAEVAERVRKKIEQFQFVYQEQAIQVTVSLGVASLKKELIDSNELYRNADRALYDSKKSGKNKVTVSPN